jgi:phosphoglycerate dehydrogenase-like enzyme
MIDLNRIAVTSRSFSRHPILRQELLDAHPNVTFNDGGETLSGDSLIEFLKGHDGVISGLEVFGDTEFDALPDLKVIAKYGVGFDALDIDAMARRGIKLGWTGGVNKRSVSELVIAFAISLLRYIPALNTAVRQDQWSQGGIGSPPSYLLSERTVGIIGCGYVGKDLAQLLRAFGCLVLAHDIRDFSEFYAQHGIRAVDLETVLREADIVTLHLPFDDSTKNILNRERLSLLKQDAILINAARGGLVDETALKEALKENRIVAAAFDVFAAEPPEDLELLNLPNFIATPHIGGSTEEAKLAMGRAAIRGLTEARVPTADWPQRG